MFLIAGVDTGQHPFFHHCGLDFPSLRGASRRSNLVLDMQVDVLPFACCLCNNGRTTPFASNHVTRDTAKGDGLMPRWCSFCVVRYSESHEEI